MQNLGNKDAVKQTDHQQFMLDMFKAAVDAALPAKHVARYLPEPPPGRTLVVGAGKASAAMAQAVEKHWPEPLSGLVITPHGAKLDCEHIEIVEANHPVPDDAGAAASARIMQLVQNLNKDDLVISLISGGGSALLSLPGEGLTLADKQAVNAALLSSGAAIDEMNCVRKHLSKIKGGRLAAAAYPAKVITLCISDVPGDDPSMIASGPTVPDATTTSDALNIVERYNMLLPDAAMHFLKTDAAETPKAHELKMSNQQVHVICKPQQSLLAAAEVAQAHGYTAMILGDALEGEARDVGKVLAGIAKAVQQYGHPAKAPVVLISGGETTVTVRKKGGKGGRNAECLLAFVQAIGNKPNIQAIACDTDGIDGSEDNAGALWTHTIAQACQQQQLNMSHYLDNNNAWAFFNACNGLVKTGATHTNVNDFRAIVVDSPN